MRIAKRRVVFVCLVVALWGLLQCALANLYPFEIFTDNGPWGTNGASFGDADLNLFVEVYNGAGEVKLKFRNESTLPPDRCFYCRCLL